MSSPRSSNQRGHGAAMSRFQEASSSNSRKSKRLVMADKKKGLDEETVKRRIKKSIENLEKDNFLEDPQPDLIIPSNYGSNEESMGNKRARRKRGNNVQRLKLAEYFKTRFTKTFGQLIEEDCTNNDGPNYVTAQAPPPTKPPRHFCVVCGFFAKYTCTTCSARHCSIKCLEIHVETRCLKWVV